MLRYRNEIDAIMPCRRNRFFRADGISKARLAFPEADPVRAIAANSGRPQAAGARASARTDASIFANEPGTVAAQWDLPAAPRRSAALSRAAAPAARTAHASCCRLTRPWGAGAAAGRSAAGRAREAAADRAGRWVAAMRPVGAPGPGREACRWGAGWRWWPAASAGARKSSETCHAPARRGRAGVEGDATSLCGGCRGRSGPGFGLAWR